MKPAAATIAAVLAVAVVVPIGATARPSTDVTSGVRTRPGCAVTATHPEAAAVPKVGGRLRPIGARPLGCPAAP